MKGRQHHRHRLIRQVDRLCVMQQHRLSADVYQPRHFGQAGCLHNVLCACQKNFSRDEMLSQHSHPDRQHARSASVAVSAKRHQIKFPGDLTFDIRLLERRPRTPAINPGGAVDDRVAARHACMSNERLSRKGTFQPPLEPGRVTANIVRYDAWREASSNSAVQVADLWPGRQCLT